MKLLVIPLTKRKSEPTHYKANFSNGWHLSVPDNCPDIYDLEIHNLGGIATVIDCPDLVDVINRYKLVEEIKKHEES